MAPKAANWVRNKVRGETGLAWERAGRPNWDRDQTIKATEAADERLRSLGLNPSPTFRRNRDRGNRIYVAGWVMGCCFPWLNPRR